MTSALQRAWPLRRREPLERVFASAYPLLQEFPEPESLPNAVRLVKMRADYFEFAAYRPITQDGIHWARGLFTNRLNTGNSGSPRLIRDTLANLFASSVEAPVTVNVSTGTQAQSPDASVGTSGAAARVGTWTSSATVSGVTDVRYSTTVGDYVEYTMTGVTRIVCRHYGNSSVGGVAVMSVTESAAEIDDAFFVTRPGKLVDLRLALGFLFTPIVNGLDPTKTYTVRMTVDASNPGSGRVYDGGLVGYNGVDFNAVGVHGTCQTQSLGAPAVNTSAFLVAGAISVYEVTDTTRIDWRRVTNPAGGQVAFKVFDSVGVEIGDYSVTTADTYLATSVLGTVTVADGLTKGTYYLHVYLLNTKHASSTNYRMYDYGAIGIDETSPGDPATSTFDDIGVLADTTSAALITMQGIGNLEFAMKARNPADAAGVDEDFVGGTHGNEGAPSSVVVKIDGAVVDYAGAAAGDSWNGESIEITFSTNLEFPNSADVFATLAQTLYFDRAGYAASYTRTMTADAMVLEEYVLMVQAPKGGGAEGAYGGGIRHCVVSPGGSRLAALNDNDSSVVADRVGVTEAVLYNDDLLVSNGLLNHSEVVAAFAGIAGTSGGGFLQDRSDGFSKFYIRPKTFTATTGSLIESGHTYTAERLMRIALR